MTAFQALILGAVQGFTEFLPVSSSGHLALMPALFGWAEHPAAFDAFLHLGTLGAVLIVLRGDLARVRKGLFVPGDPWGRLGWMVLAATLPILAVGFLVSEVFELDLVSPEGIVGALAFWGVALYLADRYADVIETKVEKVGWKRALLIGVAQVMALFPGTSRSGVTITAARATGLSREAAARFSFLLSIPAVTAAGLLSVFQIAKGSSVELLPAFVGLATSFACGMLAIRWLLKLLQTVSFAPFALYRLALAAVAWLALVR